MDLIDYLEVARRRWMLLLSGGVIALLAVWITLPEAGEVHESTTYLATTTMIATPSDEGAFGLPTIALFASVGEVPKRAAERLGFDQDPQVLAALVSTAVDPATGTMTISSTDRDGPAAAQRANVFAEELVAYFQGRDRGQAEARLAVVNRSLAETAARIAELDAKLASEPRSTVVEAERIGVQRHYEELVAEAASLQGDLAGTAPVEILQRAVPVPASAPAIAPPSDPWKRLLIGSGLGLALGLALALLIERLDSRMRTRDQVEAAFELPVLAEIPSRPWRERRAPTIASAVDPGGAAAEAYRALRSTLLLLRRTRDDAPDQDRDGQPSVVMVTSCRPAEGKTSTVANLAVVMAESGRSVLVLSLDFRNPRIHDYLDAPSGTGLSDLLSAGCPEELEGVVRDTAFPGVRLATTGQEISHPGALLTSAGDVIAFARELADVVLIDTAPLLAVSDAVDLSPHVDAVVLVTKVRRTTTAQARAAHRLLSRLGVPALGAVLVGVPASGPAYSGYPGGTSLAHQLAGRLGVTPQERRDERSPESASSKGPTSLGGQDG